MRRVATAVCVGLLAIVSLAAPAGADEPAPTDYRSEVMSVEPAADAVELRFIGGDNLVEMTVTPDHDVLVIGYRGEPYLWFQPDGSKYTRDNCTSPAAVVRVRRLRPR